MEEKSLVKSNNGFFSNIIQKIKIKIFGNKQKQEVQEQEISIKNTKYEGLSDIELLKEVMNGEIEINEIDSVTKQRLIDMCHTRQEEINREIVQIQEKTERINNLINELKSIG